jgi:hypothetical protein
MNVHERQQKGVLRAHRTHLPKTILTASTLRHVLEGVGENYEALPWMQESWRSLFQQIPVCQIASDSTVTHRTIATMIQCRSPIYSNRLLYYP